MFRIQGIAASTVELENASISRSYMNDYLLHAYHLMPHSLRNVAASIRGLTLKKWRYGPNTERLIEEALGREQWSADEWKRWQEERLAHLLDYAAKNVPFYRDMWQRRRRHGDYRSWDYLDNWPLLHKEQLRANPRQFLAEGIDPRKLIKVQTSGTTGTPLELWRNRTTNRDWYALFEARTRRWNGVRFSQPWAILGGQPVVPASQGSPPFWVWNSALNQLYLSSNHVSPESAQDYLEALNKYRITHMIAYPSSLAILARLSADLNLSAPSLKVIFTNSEALHTWQRRQIEQGLQCEVREVYGMAEIVAAASECEAGNLHLWPDVGWVDVFQDDSDERVSSGTPGRLVCTGLLNPDMPLINYVVGDRGTMGNGKNICSCGRALPIVKGIEGRINDVLVGPNGRAVYWINPIFYGLDIQEAQVIQNTLETLIVKLVPGRTLKPGAEQTIDQRLRARLGEVRVEFRRMTHIPRGPNGKFRAVVCNLAGKEFPITDSDQQRHFEGTH